MFKYLFKDGALVKSAAGKPLGINVDLPNNIVQSATVPNNAGAYPDGTVWVKNTDKAWVKITRKTVRPEKNINILPYFMSLGGADISCGAPVSLGMLREIYGTDAVYDFANNYLSPIYSSLDIVGLSDVVRRLLTDGETDAEHWFSAVSSYTTCLLLSFGEADTEQSDNSMQYTLTFDGYDFPVTLDTSYSAAYLHGKAADNNLLLIPGVFDAGLEADLNELRLENVMYDGNSELTDSHVIAMLAISPSTNFARFCDLRPRVGSSITVRINAPDIADEIAMSAEAAPFMSCENIWALRLIDATASETDCKLLMTAAFGGCSFGDTLNIVFDGLSNSALMQQMITAFGLTDIPYLVPSGGIVTVSEQKEITEHLWSD